MKQLKDPDDKGGDNNKYYEDKFRTDMEHKHTGLITPDVLQYATPGGSKALWE